jgi:hypothetical protein
MRLPPFFSIAIVLTASGALWSGIVLLVTYLAGG